MSRVENPFSAFIRKPKEIEPNLYTQYRRAVEEGNVRLANLIAKKLGLELISI